MYLFNDIYIYKFYPTTKLSGCGRNFFNLQFYYFGITAPTFGILFSSLSSTSHMATSSNTSIPNVSHLVSIKLDRYNYLLWKSQFLPILRSNDLIGFVDGTKSCPPKLVVADDKDSTKEVVNENLLLGSRKINYF